MLNSLNPDHAQLVAKSKFLAKDVSRRHLADKELISRFSNSFCIFIEVLMLSIFATVLMSSSLLQGSE